MQQSSVHLRWAELIVWVVVNAVNLLQGVGFLSRVSTGKMTVNHLLGMVMIGFGVPAAVALGCFCARAGRLAVLGWPRGLPGFYSA